MMIMMLMNLKTYFKMSTVTLMMTMTIKMIFWL